MYQTVRFSTFDNTYLQPQIEDGLIISDHSLIFAIGCPQLLEDPSTYYLLATIDVDGTVREVRIVQLYGITV